MFSLTGNRTLCLCVTDTNLTNCRTTQSLRPTLPVCTLIGLCFIVIRLALSLSLLFILIRSHLNLHPIENYTLFI